MVDVIVIGAGHAGCEAAAAAARRGASTLLVTTDASNIGAMSCNPAIGGVGKGHLVRELDVFDGLMARAADHAAIHHRMLNSSKGAAVRGPRIQADRKRYRAAMLALLRYTPNLQIRYADVTSVAVHGGQVAGVVLGDGAAIEARAVVIAAGTFLGGKLFCGAERQPGGRVAERAQLPLARQLRELGLSVGRLKTGTPPRLDGRTIDWGRLSEQPSDAIGWTMSDLPPTEVAPQIACAVTRTRAVTHDIIRRAFDRSPLYSGAIEGRGPRYCPSIEDKVIRFAERDSHQIFLEPEGLDTHWVYPNGISTSLPTDVQATFVRSIEGLERAEIVQPGYAVEYDFLDPRGLDHALRVRTLPGLFLAGQINGTTGYEEAAAQGLVAGLNAAADATGIAPVRFERDESYIGVMIDDLVLQGVSEPYRMLTARAERRLWLRADNASTRLGDAAIASGAIGSARIKRTRQRAEARAATREAFMERPDLLAKFDVEKPDAGGDILRESVIEVVEELQYAPYVERQNAELDRVRRDAQVSLSHIGSFASVGGLSAEMVERLDRARPANLAEAGRIQGITPAALTSILVSTRKRAA